MTTDRTAGRPLAFAAALLCATAPIAAVPALAQAAPQEDDAAAPAGGIADIVVTAQRRAESLQKTPISVAALTGEALEARGITNISGLQAQVPNLQLTPHPNSATTARIFIRGIGNADDQITQDPSVAIYLDGIYVGRSQGLSSEVAEIERIEVLRGPQGSLYGRNATGGAINFVSRAPQLGVFEAKQTFSLGNYDMFRARTRVNIPIGETAAVELGSTPGRTASSAMPGRGLPALATSAATATAPPCAGNRPPASTCAMPMTAATSTIRRPSSRRCRSTRSTRPGRPKAPPPSPISRPMTYAPKATT